MNITLQTRLGRIILGHFSLAAAILCAAMFAQPAEAQIPQDVRDIFNGMLDSLDEDVRQRFQTAIAQDTTQVEFSPDEFKRFRANPVNPFEGLDKIKVGNRKSNIVLNFELPSMRNRKIQRNERQNPLLLNSLYPVVAQSSNSTVEIYSGKRHVAMGAIIRSDGLILTKFSEIENRDHIRVRLPGGRKYSAKTYTTDPENDLAIVQIAARGLTAVQWSDAQPLLGSFLLTPSYEGKPIAMGAYSVRPRSTRDGEQAFLGVQPVVADRGVRAIDIVPGTAAFAAGLQSGDVIVSLAGKPTRDVASLVQAIRMQRPGDVVEIQYLRDGVTQNTNATLAGAGIAGERAARFKMMNRLGAVPSRRDGNFPNVFQHDTPLFPEHCGGPIVDLDGQVVGLNIARKGRAASFALPAGYVKTLIAEMLQTTAQPD